MKSESLPPLFYFRDLPAEGESFVFSDEEARHISAARRLQAGDTVHVTDGVGKLAHCELLLVESRPRTVQCRVLSSENQCGPRRKLVLASAIPKGERQGVMLDMATQLGMDHYIPVNCERSTTRFQARMKERWERIVVSAGKQSRRCIFPTLGDKTDIDSLVGSLDENDLVLVGDVHGKSLSQLDQGIMSGAQRWLALVGPEGGFSGPELELIDHDRVVTVSLGTHILRTETAAVSLLAALSQLTR